MRDEARFQMRGVVSKVLDVTRGGNTTLEVRLQVDNGSRVSLLPIQVRDEELAVVARKLREGERVLALGSVTGGINEKGYPFAYFWGRAFYLEPAAAEPRGEQRVVYDEPQVQPRGGRSFTPAQMHEKMADDDIPF